MKSGSLSEMKQKHIKWLSQYQLTVFILMEIFPFTILFHHLLNWLILKLLKFYLPFLKHIIKVDGWRSNIKSFKSCVQWLCM